MKNYLKRRNKMVKYDYTANQVIGFLLLGVFLGGILGGVMFWDTNTEKTKEELGGSICEEEYNMEYESYHHRILKCKPFKESYDGIKVEVTKIEEK